MFEFERFHLNLHVDEFQINIIALRDHFCQQSVLNTMYVLSVVWIKNKTDHVGFKILYYNFRITRNVHHQKTDRMTFHPHLHTQ